MNLRSILIGLSILVAIALVIEHVDRYLIIKRLANDGWKLYHMKNCGACERQKKVLGMMIMFLPNQDCSVNCPAGIVAFPTWRNEKRNLTVKGFVNRKGLRKL